MALSANSAESLCFRPAASFSIPRCISRLCSALCVLQLMSEDQALAQGSHAWLSASFQRFLNPIEDAWNV